MSMQTAGDIPLLITSDNSSSERRITPSWTIGHLKARLEPVTGIPPLSQKLTLKFGSGQAVPIEAADEENTQLAHFSLAPYAEIHVSLLFFLHVDVALRFAKRFVTLHCTTLCSLYVGETVQRAQVVYGSWSSVGEVDAQTWLALSVVVGLMGQADIERLVFV
jgi:hypothetical protein